jgi:hypothetical protein
MFVRALIVVLAVLNLGVAAWWLSRPADAPTVAPTAQMASGVATLQLAGLPADAKAAQPEPTPTPSTVPPPAPIAAAAPAKPALPAAQTLEPHTAPAARCLSLGPFAAQADAQAALTRAGALLEKGALREERDGDASSYRVVMPSVGDRATAQAIVARIAASGLKDYYVLPQGEDNSIALGQYRSREGAERRQSELKAKGFSAELLASGGQSRWWIDARTAATGASVLAKSGASRQRSLDCASMR